MLAVNYTNLRDNMKECFDRVADSFEPMLVTRKDENMVILSQSLYDSMVETMYLMGSRSNYEHLMKSVAQYRDGKAKEHPLNDKLD